MAREVYRTEATPINRRPLGMQVTNDVAPIYEDGVLEELHIPLNDSAIILRGDCALRVRDRLLDGEPFLIEIHPSRSSFLHRP